MLFLSRSYGTSMRGEGLRQKLLFIVVALLLSSGAYAALAAGEARAEEPQQPEERAQRHTLVIGGEAAKQTDIDTTVGLTPPVESLPSEPPLTQIPPLVDSTPVVPQPEPALQSKPGPSVSVSLGIEQEAKSGGENLAFEVSNEEGAFAQRNRQYGTATLPNNSELGALAPAPPGVTLVREPRGSEAVPPSLELVPEHSVEDTPVALGENRSASSQVEEALPVVPSQTTTGAAPSIPLWEERPTDDTTTQGMVAPVPYPPTYERQVDAPQPKVNLEPALISAAQTLRSTVANVLWFFTDDSSGPATSESEDPLGDTPEPSAPLAPPVGYASLTVLAGGGQTSFGGSAAPLLLLCILASGVILLRWDGRLARAFCEVPKPSSALLRPLERPG